MYQMSERMLRNKLRELAAAATRPGADLPTLRRMYSSTQQELRQRFPQQPTPKKPARKRVVR